MQQDIIQNACLISALDMAKFINAIGLIVIGGCTAYIAWQQWRTANAKLNFDLFGYRYAIFEKTWKLLSQIESTPDSSFFNFTNMIPQARFLFDSKIEDYLNEISAKWSNFLAINENIKTRGLPDNIKKRNELMKWFYSEANKGCKEKFGIFLDFKNWKHSKFDRAQ